VWWGALLIGEEEDETQIYRKRLTDLYRRPGFKIRRAKQISQSIFDEACSSLGITTTQFGVMFALNALDSLDQITVARLIGLDRSTAGLVIGLLESRELIARETDVNDRRRRILRLTPQGQEVFRQAAKPAERAKLRLLDCLLSHERRHLIKLLTQLVNHGNLAPEQGADRKKLQELYRRPGFLLRRAHQLSVALFLDHCKDLQLTPSQYGVLYVLDKCENIDQVTLARLIAIDRSTIALVLRLLRKRGCVVKKVGEDDMRRRILSLTSEGRELLQRASIPARQAMNDLVAPLSETDQAALFGMIDRIIGRNEALFSTVPDI